MSGFQLDTSGVVEGKSWADLSFFTQGYIEAMLRDAGVERYDAIAPETLARIISDCSSMQNYLTQLYAPLRYGRSGTDGRYFWERRNLGQYEDFPPLTVQLGDDGKVRFAA